MSRRDLTISGLPQAPARRGRFRASWRALAVLAAATAVFAACGGSSSPTQVSPPHTRQDCIASAVFGAPADSVYCAPFPAGTSSHLLQSYCSAPGRSHDTRFAIDFSCQHGDVVLAARDGMVEVVEEGWSDQDPQGGHENRVLVRHADGTVAFYAHFQPDSIPVEEGDAVTSGQPIGRCGSSGEISGIPHLHFEVFESQHYDFDHTVPVNFSNLDGPHDSRNGLMVGETYLVLACV